MPLPCLNPTWHTISQNIKYKLFGMVKGLRKVTLTSLFLCLSHMGSKLTVL